MRTRRIWHAVAWVQHAQASSRVSTELLDGLIESPVLEKVGNHSSPPRDPDSNFGAPRSALSSAPSMSIFLAGVRCRTCLPWCRATGSQNEQTVNSESQAASYKYLKASRRDGKPAPRIWSTALRKKRALISLPPAPLLYRRADVQGQRWKIRPQLGGNMWPPVSQHVENRPLRENQAIAGCSSSAAAGTVSSQRRLQSQCELAEFCHLTSLRPMQSSLLRIMVLLPASNLECSDIRSLHEEMRAEQEHAGGDSGGHAELGRLTSLRLGSPVFQSSLLSRFSSHPDVL